MKPAIILAAVLLALPASAEEPKRPIPAPPYNFDWSSPARTETVVMPLWQYEAIRTEIKQLKARIAELESKESKSSAKLHDKIRCCPGCSGDRMTKSGAFQWCAGCGWDNGLRSCRENTTTKNGAINFGHEYYRTYQIQCGPEE